METLAQAKEKAGGKRIPYSDFLELARYVESHLAKSPKLSEAADPILVSLRELVPHHIKVGFSMEMMRCGAEETGRAFLKYPYGCVDSRN